MELVIKGSSKSKKIEISKGILTIQSIEEDIILENLSDKNDLRVIDNRNLFFIADTVLNEMFCYNDMPDLEYVNEIIQIFDYDSSFLDRKIDSLSLMEKILLNLFRNLSFNTQIIVFMDFFKGFDISMEKKIIEMFKYLVNKKYIVILVADDINRLYKYGDYSVISNKTTIKYGKTEDIYSNVDTLLKLKLEVPTLSYITYKAKKDKDVKLFYSKDVRDIIKDVYKHV